MTQKQLEAAINNGEKYFKHLDLRNVNMISMCGVTFSECLMIDCCFTGIILEDVHLFDCDLKWSYFHECTIRYCSIRFCDLLGVSFNCSNLIETNFSNSNFKNASMERVSSFIGCGLWGVIGNSKQIKSLNIFPEYDVVYTHDRLQIGCENHSIEEWKNFDYDRILVMDGNDAVSFWERNKDLIFSIIENSPAKKFCE